MQEPRTSSTPASSRRGTRTSSSTTPTPTASTPTATCKVSNRPREFKLDGLDPSRVLTADQAEQLGVPESEPGDPKLRRFENVPNCYYSSLRGPSISYTIGFNSTAGYEVWNSGGTVDVTPMAVSGYDAVWIKLKGDKPDSCTLAVDVADGEHLYVNYMPIGDKGTQEELCRKATAATEMALATLPSLS
ncbi:MULTISPECIES: DUF3558 domain-containing protein [Actinosynnema]|uniref:DUF3558 domain-containing protein n=1 Tax=Actinosynnema TaxID=40566 RepID=UPI0020A5D4D8|nr:DUF3558 domain-containing protein [Actinosynnema pretiosum]